MLRTNSAAESAVRAHGAVRRHTPAVNTPLVTTIVTGHGDRAVVERGTSEHDGYWAERVAVGASSS